MSIKFLLLIYLKIALISSICRIEENHCSRCNPVTKLCVKCDKDIYVPDKKGGCELSQKCVVGLNQCIECNEDGRMCQKCIEGYFPDENGGCSYTDNCKSSYRGTCLECQDDFILIGKDDFYQENNLKICKSIFSDDLKDCEEIDKSNGFCEKCKEGLYLNSGDKKCSQTENCYESIFDVCKKCNKNLYLDRKDGKCKNQTDIFEHCKESFDGKTCQTCDDDYFFDEEGKCIAVNYCKKSINEYQCEECASGYFLNQYKTSCVTTKNCYNGDAKIGVCTSCIPGYYIDYKDGVCKLNDKDNSFKNCRIADEGVCVQCVGKFELGEDNKCTDTKHCAESNNGICLECSNNYFIGLDHKCTNIEHCVYSDDYTCTECEDPYFYDEESKTCKIGKDNFENCKSGKASSHCEICKEDFYINQIDNLCYSNKEQGNFYKCSKTDSTGEYCIECKKDYYLGDKDNKCTLIEGCVESENEKKCISCDLYYCLDSKTGKCIINYEIKDEESKFYYRCMKTNEEGNACEVCEEDYVLENGLCVDKSHCLEENEDGECIKCKSDDEFESYCLNKDFGCVQYYTQNCLKCDNNLDLDKCTKCLDGYHLDDNGECN